MSIIIDKYNDQPN